MREFPYVEGMWYLKIKDLFSCFLLILQCGGLVHCRAMQCSSLQCIADQNIEMQFYVAPWSAVYRGAKRYDRATNGLEQIVLLVSNLCKIYAVFVKIVSCCDNTF